MDQLLTPSRLRFGPFLADFQACELRKNGTRIRLQDKPMRLLAALTANPGEVVSREELQRRLWPQDTFVDFEAGLNIAVRKLREALGDNTETPRYIETVPKHGYRFVCQVDQQVSLRTSPSAMGAPEAQFENLTIEQSWLSRIAERTNHFASPKRLVPLFSVLGALAIPIAFWWWNLGPPAPRVTDAVRIANARNTELLYLAPLSDGARVYFQTKLSPGTTFDLWQVSTLGGETVRIPLPLQWPELLDISSSGTELLVGAGDFKVTPERPVWVVPLPAGPPHKVGDIFASEAIWAPDRGHLVFVNNHDLFVAKPDGSDVRKLATIPYGRPSGIRISPDGTRLRFTVSTGSGRPQDDEIMEIGTNGNGLHRLPLHGCCGIWSADGRYYYFQTDRDIWVLAERRSILGKIEFGDPMQLTSGPVPFQFPWPSPNGKQLFVLGSQPRVELVHYESGSKKFVPFLGGISAGELEVSPDGQWVAYTTYPESNLWRSKLDGSERLQLTFAPTNAHEPRWSPDGKQILFTDFPHKIFVVPANGGTPRQLMPEERPIHIGAGAWLPDGNSILFVQAVGCPSCLGIYLLDLKSQQVTRLPGSEKMFASRLSRNGRYLIAILGFFPGNLMLYDFQTKRWSVLARGLDSNSTVWSHDSQFVYGQLKDHPAELVRISVPDGKIEPVLDLKDVSLGGFFSGWISLLPDDSPLLMLDRTTQDIYRLDLQFR